MVVTVARIEVVAGGMAAKRESAVVEERRSTEGETTPSGLGQPVFSWTCSFIGSKRWMSVGIGDFAGHDDLAAGVDGGLGVVALPDASGS